ncbi:DUF5067 domain-containing protein [Bifidobacterium samirii]|uniref:DUF5067 domain-containing protein n=1 Tax=Bifidobacterium samirii TaxID=2306974 RepID=A0A430FU84_9BIFI|nr:DUF5067 domain-containing protein [Bifidobacterium samirii]RSX56721.1 hypothetical protein D2E24_1011 [Bifidobacterium samirii]
MDTSTMQQPTQQPAPQQAAKKPVWKRWWFWVVVVIVVAALFGGGATQSAKDGDVSSPNAQTQTQQPADGGDTSADASKADDAKDETAKPSGEQDMEGDLNQLHVKIVSAVRSGNDYNGQPTVLVTYEWTNNTDKNNSFAALANPKVFQNGASLDTAIYLDSPEGYDVNSYLTELQAGASGTVTLGYVLEGDSPVTVDVTDLVSWDDSVKVTHTFDLQ